MEGILFRTLTCSGPFARFLGGVPPAASAHFQWTEALNAREWATAIWATASVAAMMLSRDLRRGVFGVVTTLLVSGILLISVSAMLVYIAGIVFAASQIDLWNAHMIGATFAWTVTALVGFSQVLRVSQDRRFTRKAVRRAMALAVVLDAYLNLFVVGFPFEMLLVPFLVFVGAMLAGYEYIPQLQTSEHDPGRSCLKSFVGILGIGAIVYATVQTVSEIAAGKLGELGRGLILPLWLNVALIPCILLIGLWAAYHDAFIRLQIGAEPSSTALRYAKRALVREVGLNVYALGGFGPPWPYRFSEATTPSEARAVARALVEQRSSS